MLLPWLPVQVSAMPWLAYQCDQHHSGAQEHAAQFVGPAHHVPSGDQQSFGGEDSGSASNVHTCCHSCSGTVAGLSLASGTAVPIGIEPGPPAHSYSFFPELPKRPPLAGLV